MFEQKKLVVIIKDGGNDKLVNEISSFITMVSRKKVNVVNCCPVYGNFPKKAIIETSTNEELRNYIIAKIEGTYQGECLFNVLN